GSKYYDGIYDLYAGCGVIGIEAAKIIQAKCLYFVENSPPMLNVLHWNCKNLAGASYRIVAADVNHFMGQHRIQNSLILANPPYYFLTEGRLSPDNHRRSCTHLEQRSALQFIAQIKTFEGTNDIAILLKSASKFAQHF